MPYINPSDRPKFDKAINKLKPASAGELNYVISRIAHQYLKERGLRYANINEAIGVLECAKMELYRKVAVPYEEEKIKENGGVDVKTCKRAISVVEAIKNAQ